MKSSFEYTLLVTSFPVENSTGLSKPFCFVKIRKKIKVRQLNFRKKLHKFHIFFVCQLKKDVLGFVWENVKYMVFQMYNKL